jgi:hypothetical protein
MITLKIRKPVVTKLTVLARYASDIKQMKDRLLYHGQTSRLTAKTRVKPHAPSSLDK